MSLRAINQNLLPVLLEILRERSVTRAALNLGLTQPAVSKALRQIRAILGDPLLTKSGSKFVLTPRGQALLPAVEAICTSVEDLWREQTFDCTTSRREFVITGGDYCAMIMASALAPALAVGAPGVSMRFVDTNPHLLIDERIDIDFAMISESLVPRQLIEAGSIIPLYIEDFVAVVARDHPLLSSGGSVVDALASVPSITFGDDDPHLPKEIRVGKHLNLTGGPPLAVVRQFLTLPLLAVLTGTVAVVPRRLVELIAPVVALEVVAAMPTERQVPVILAWNRRHEGDLGHRWFRELVAAHLCADRSVPDLQTTAPASV